MDTERSGASGGGRPTGAGQKPPWSEVAPILREALGLPRERRDSFLVEACSGSPALLEEVRRLLRIDRAAVDFLRPPTALGLRRGGRGGADERVGALLEQAATVPVERRGPWLEHTCGDDSEVLSRVRLLLEGTWPGESDLQERDPAPQGSAMARLLAKLEQLPATTDRYLVEGEIARGGQGVVLRVRDETLQRGLAMKVVLGRGDLVHGSPATPDSRGLGRFLEEAIVTGQLDHPGIVPVHELGIDAEGRVYFTMKLVQGSSLEQVLTELHAGRGGWNLPRVVGLLTRACEAVAYAHSKGVLHRDLKPANVMVGRFGEVYVMDWGLARVLDPGDGTSGMHSFLRSGSADREGPVELGTMEGDVLGTPAYMPPEQARGSLEDLGPPADVYSLGAILYHVLTGHGPYREPDAPRGLLEVWKRVREGPPPPVTSLAPNAPPELVAVCEKAMAREPGRRYASALELGEDLRAHVEGRVVSAHDTGTWTSVRKWAARNPWLAGSLSTTVLVLVVALAATSWLYGDAVEARGRADDQARRARAEQRVASLRAAETSLRFQEEGRARRYLDRIDPELRGYAWDHLDRSIRTSSRWAIGEVRGEGSSGIAWAPDGSRLATADPAGGLRVRDVVTRRTVWLREVGEVRALEWDPAGERLLVGTAQGELQVLDPEGQVLDARPGLGSPVLAGGFLPDGGWWVSTEDGHTRIHAEGGTEIACHTYGAFLRWAAVGPGGRWLALVGQRGGAGAIVIELPTGRTLPPIDLGRRYAAPPAFSPDGRWLAVGAASTPGLWLVDLDARERVEAPPANEVVDLRFTHDSQRLITTSRSGVAQVWSIADGSILSALELQGIGMFTEEQPGGALAWTGSDDGLLRLWETTSGEELLVLELATSTVSWEPHGRRAVATLDEGLAWIHGESE